MKKIMEVNIGAYNDDDCVYFDVSTKELLNKAYKWMFDKLFTPCIEEDIKDASDINFSYMKDCSICDKTGKIFVKDKEFICPACNGLIFSKDEEWETLLSLYKKAKKNNYSAMKKLFNEFGHYYNLDGYSVINIKKI